MEQQIRIGLECLTDRRPAKLDGARLGLLMNQASLDSNFQYACDIVAQHWPGQLKAIFAPQHGLWCEQQANMIESPHGRYEPLDVPVYSLYSETRLPTSDMLSEIDVLMVDLQDVGTRVYTFAWTIVNCMRACADRSISMLILDRPNPLGGRIVEGPLLADGYQSFVGLLPIPMRHGLTLGELAQLANHELGIRADLEVERMSGWRREMFFPQTGRAWTMPSPNMPRFETAMCYPGQVLLEGTNLSEGRGTTIPFEVVGAPFVDPYRLVNALDAYPHPGVRFRPVRFVPTFDKWAGRSCGGVAWHVEDDAALRSFQSTLTILASVRRLWPQDFEWLPPPYEYELEKMPIDILYGSSRLRQTLDEATFDELTIKELCDLDQAAWKLRVKPFLLYGSEVG